MDNFRRYAVLSFLLILPTLAHAAPTSFVVVADEKSTEVEFRSKATLETFEGRTHELSGTFVFDPEDLTAFEGELRCDLASLDTGIGLRNKHMRDNVLHTDEHPTATFVLEAGSGGALVVGSPVELEVTGKMTLHGVTRPMKAAVAATLVSPEEVTFSATFQVTLADFEIPRPKMLVMKVAETVDLTIAARATAGPPPTSER